MRYRNIFNHLVLAVSSTSARRTFVFFGLLLVGTPAADAARVNQSIVACHDEASAKNLAEVQGKPNNNKHPVSPATQKAKTTQPCSDLPEGMTVTVEQTDGQYVCVRPWGGLECFWTKSEAIDQSTQRAPDSPKPLWGKAHFNGFKPSFTTQF